MKRIISLLSAVLAVLVLFAFAQTKEKTYKVQIDTKFGAMVFELNNNTPLHRDNFLKLINESYYDSSIFHRVINEFMIQGGMGLKGTDDKKYTIAAEFVDTNYHKKGALCAARMADMVNPQKSSSANQFYIVQGRVFNDKELEMIQQRMRKTLNEKQIEIYKTIGGAPHLDGEYTVFGQCVSGFNVIDSVALVPVNPKKEHRPLENVYFSVKIIEDGKFINKLFNKN